MARICLIDDDIYVRNAMALGLSDLGFSVVTAPGVAAGLDLVAREGADAIVTDMHMPSSDGERLVEQARTLWPTIPIVMITGMMELADRNLADVAHELGVDALMVKPLRATELAETLKRLLAK